MNIALKFVAFGVRIAVHQIELQFASEIVSRYLRCGFHAMSMAAERVTDYQGELLISSVDSGFVDGKYFHIWEHQGSL